jgi:hypothetical protein
MMVHLHIVIHALKTGPLSDFGRMREPGKESLITDTSIICIIYPRHRFLLLRLHLGVMELFKVNREFAFNQGHSRAVIYFD